MTTETTNPMYTPEQVSKILGCSLRRVQYKLKQGEIKSIKVGGTEKKVHARIPKAYLSEYLQERNPDMTEEDVEAILR